MTVAYTAEERAGLDAKARAMLEACPDVGSFIRRGLGRDPEAETLVYLRTALDPAPVVTKAREFQGLLNAATRWLRRQGVGPRDVVSLLAANCPASSVLYWAAMSSASIQPLNLLFTREAIAAQLNAAKAENSVHAAARRAGRSVREVRGAAGAGAEPGARRRAPARRARRVRR